MGTSRLNGKYKGGMTQEERLQEIEHAKDFLIDITPHNIPNFWEVLQETAEAYVDAMDDDNVKHYSED